MKRLLSLMVLAGVMLPATAAQANDFPTLDRVLWVHECMREHPDGGHYEMVSKCSCALDRIAGQMGHEQYMAMKTSSDARSIGGERGGYIRANKQEQKVAREFGAIQKAAMKACFIKVD